MDSFREIICMLENRNYVKDWFDCSVSKLRQVRTFVGIFFIKEMNCPSNRTKCIGKHFTASLLDMRLISIHCFIAARREIKKGSITNILKFDPTMISMSRLPGSVQLRLEFLRAEIWAVCDFHQNCI